MKNKLINKKIFKKYLQIKYFIIMDAIIKVNYKVWAAMAVDQFLILKEKNYFKDYGCLINHMALESSFFHFIKNKNKYYIMKI